MAEFVLGYMLAREIDVFQRLERQRDRRWYDQQTGSLAGKTLGIMGTGSIGRHIAAMAVPFNMRVLGFSRSGRPVSGFAEVFASADFHAFLGKADYLVGVLPETPATIGLLDQAAFTALPEHAYFINVGRGSLVDEQALSRALASGELAGAVLDVFRQEPLRADSPLWDVPNLLITGHVAAHSWPEDIAGIFIENYRKFQRDDVLNYIIDFERGY
jgi:phosphoglycerate dehydrogenase-like enzyme